MAIKRLSSANPYNQSIEDIDENTVELEGLISQANFNNNELDAIYSDLGLSRKFQIWSGAGNSLTTYTNWTHVTTETGYSIWSLAFTNFQDNSENEMYLDDVVLTYKGEADQVAYTEFEQVWLYDGSTYTDGTADAAEEGGTAQSLMADTSSYLYVGNDGTFSALDFDFDTKGSNYTLVVEYWDNSDWTALTANADSLVDNTSNFKSDGRLTYTIPTDWTLTTVNSITKYYLRISTSTTPVTTATAYSIFPGNSVYSLLQLSNSEVQDESWAWCYFSNNVYATVKNAGTSAYEGNTYITSSSSVANKQNYFVYNHAYKMSYEQTSYTTGAMFSPTYGFRWYATGSGIKIINWSNNIPFTITNTNSTALALKLEAGTNDTTTGASTGTGGAVPSQISTYLALDIDGTTYKIALFAD